MAAQFWSGHAHGWELAAWWLCIAAPLTAIVWACWPSCRRRHARTATETARVLRQLADAALLDDNHNQTTENRNTEVDAR